MTHQGHGRIGGNYYTPLEPNCFCTCRPFVRPSVRPSPLLNTNKFQAKTISTTGKTVGLAEWIIDDTPVFYLLWLSGIVSIASIDNSTDQEDQEQDNHLHTELNSPDVKKEKDDDSYHINVEEVSSPDDLNQPFIRIPQVDCEMKIKDLKIDISEVISNDSILDETTRRNSPRKQDIFVDIEEENTKVQVNRKKTKKTIKGKVKKLKKKIKIPNFTSVSIFYIQPESSHLVLALFSIKSS